MQSSKRETGKGSRARHWGRRRGIRDPYEWIQSQAALVGHPQQESNGPSTFLGMQQARIGTTNWQQLAGWIKGRPQCGHYGVHVSRHWRMGTVARDWGWWERDRGLRGAIPVPSTTEKRPCTSVHGRGGASWQTAWPSLCSRPTSSHHRNMCVVSGKETVVMVNVMDC